MAELTDQRDRLAQRPPLTVIEPGAAEPGDGQVMTLVEHLGELRRRIFIALIAVALGTVAGFLLTPDVIRLLETPLRRAVYFTSPTGALFVQLKIALMIGIGLGSPVAFYELWAFVSPGLTQRERTLLRPWIPLALVLGALGVTVAYVTLPLATSFLLGYQIPGALEPLITADGYFGFVTTIFLAFALVMQFPIVLVLLAKAGLVKLDWMRRNRRYVLLGIFVFAVVVSPGGDPYSPTIMALVMYPLYELTIWMIGRSSHSPTDG
jgi:sec-independent protein translocase protein TatC